MTEMTPIHILALQLLLDQNDKDMEKTEKQEPKYEEAVRQLEAIVEKLENNELDIDELSTELKKAQQLIQLCKDKLTKTDAEIKKILDKE